MDLFYFDIETATNYKDWNTFKLEDERGSVLFEQKYEKMKWDDKFSSVEEAYHEQACIMSTYGRIVCISFGFIDENGGYKIKSFYGDDEKEIVESFNNLLKKIEKKNFNLSGFRILHFDLPYILHKLHRYNIKPCDIINVYNKKPWELRIVDMADDWKGKFAWSYNFDEVTYELGLDSPKNKMSGKDVSKFYWEGRIEEIKEYCEKDVKSSIEVSKKIYK